MATDITIELSYSNFGAIGAEMARLIDAECEATANRIWGNAKLLIMNPPKSGKEYKRGKRVHQASAPGEAPASDLGNLVNDSMVSQESPAEWLVTFSAQYAKALEYGAPKRRLDPRPFLRPSVEKYRDRFNDALKKIVEGG